MKGLSVLLLVFALPLVTALDLTEVIIPPQIPAMDGRSPSLSSENSTAVTFVLLSKEGVIKDYHLLVYDEGLKQSTLQYVPEQNATLMVGNGLRQLILIVDNLETQGANFFYRAEFMIVQNASFSLDMLPIGSVDGMVVKNSGEPIRGAKVAVECVREYGLQGEFETDEFGTFLLKALPVGPCTIKASKDGNLGVAKVMVAPGQLVSAQVVMEWNRSIFVWVLFLVIVVVVWVYLAARHQRKKVPKPALSTHLDVVMPTLNEREKSIVQALRERSPLSQNALTHKTLIPKTSIVRILQSLVHKKVIVILKEGKSKKIALSEWILEKKD